MTRRDIPRSWTILLLLALGSWALLIGSGYVVAWIVGGVR